MRELEEPGSEKTVLVVEDDPTTSQVMAAAFEQTRNPWRVRQADSLHRAREMMDQEPADAVLLDLGLPDALGLDTLDPFVGKTAIVVLTASARGVGKDAMRLGAEDFIVKGSATPETVVMRTEMAIHRFRRAEAGRREVERANKAAALNAMVVDSLLDAERALRTTGDVERRDLLDAATESVRNAISTLVASHLCLPPKKVAGPVVVDQILHGLGLEITRTSADEADFWVRPERLIAAVRWFIQVHLDHDQPLESIRTQRGRLILRFREDVKPDDLAMHQLREAFDPGCVTFQEEAGRATVRVLMAG